MAVVNTSRILLRSLQPSPKGAAYYSEGRKPWWARRSVGLKPCKGASIQEPLSHPGAIVVQGVLLMPKCGQVGFDGSGFSRAAERLDQEAHRLLLGTACNP